MDWTTVIVVGAFGVAFVVIACIRPNKPKYEFKPPKPEKGGVPWDTN